MSRHLADHQIPSQGERVKRFVQVERTQGPEGSHPSVKELTRRAADRPEKSSRFREFMRIARGWMT